MSDTPSALVSPARRVRSIAALYLGLAGDAPLTAPARISLRGIDRIDVCRGARRGVVRRKADGAELLVVTLADARLSSLHARVTRIGAMWVIEDLDSKNGTWVGRNRVTRAELADSDVIVVGDTALVFRTSGGDDADSDGAPASAHGFATLSPGLVVKFAEIAVAAQSPVPIEIIGETGTGKELAARAVHALSRRAGKFIAVHCGASAPALIDAELVRSADGGTLMLAEVGELPPESQAALLHGLQRSDAVRIVTATHESLDAAVAANRLRADLRAHVLGVRLELPPLRDRREDLCLLIAQLLERHAPGRAVAFSPDAVAALYGYNWPLNIRELERAIAAALAVANGRIELQHLPAALGDAVPTAPADQSTWSAEDRALRDQLSAALDRQEGNIAAVSRELGKDRTQIRRWMKRFGLGHTTLD